MSERYASASDPLEKLSRDLVDIRDTAAENPRRFEQKPALLDALRIGLDSEPHYTTTVEIILDLIAVAVADETAQPWFEIVAQIVGQRAVTKGNLFEMGFREVVGEFLPFVGVYSQVNRVSSVVLETLLHTYVKLFTVLIYKHDMKIHNPLIDQSVAVARKLDDHVESARLNQVLALYHVHFGEFHPAKTYGLRAFNDCEFIEDRAGIVDAACTLSVIYRSDLRFDRAEYYIRRAIEKFPSAKPDKRFATFFYEFGVVSFRRDKYDLALNYYQRALAIFEDYQAVYQITMTQHALVLVYLHTGRFEQAEALLSVVQSAWLRLGNKYDWVNSHFAAGELEIKRGNHSLGLRLLENAIALAYSVIEDTPARDTLVELIQAHIDRSSQVASYR